MDKFLKEYDLFPEQITDKVKEELCKMVKGNPQDYIDDYNKHKEYYDEYICLKTWEEVEEILVNHKDMYSTAVSCIIYNFS